jgi:CheY-like chemotaxis protein
MSRPVVAVLNTSEDAVSLVRLCLERAGFLVVAAFTHLFRDGKLNFHQFIVEHRPTVIVYDIAVPYEQNWALFQYFSTRPICRDIQFVVTTTNAAQVREIAGADLMLHELVGKPYDLEQIVRAVNEAAHARPIGKNFGADRRAAERRVQSGDRRQRGDRRRAERVLRES